MCQKECQKICQKHVRRNVRRYARKNAEIMFQYMPESLSDWSVMVGITRCKVTRSVFFHPQDTIHWTRRFGPAVRCRLKSGAETEGEWRRSWRTHLQRRNPTKHSDLWLWPCMTFFRKGLGDLPGTAYTPVPWMAWMAWSISTHKGLEDLLPTKNSPHNLWCKKVAVPWVLLNCPDATLDAWVLPKWAKLGKCSPSIKAWCFMYFIGSDRVRTQSCGCGVKPGQDRPTRSPVVAKNNTELFSGRTEPVQGTVCYSFSKAIVHKTMYVIGKELT